MTQIGFFPRAASDAFRTAVVMDGSERLPFGDLALLANRVSGALLARGVAPGGGVAVRLANGPEFLAVVLGCLQCGAVVTPVGTRLTGREASYIVSDCGARVVVDSREAFEELVAGQTGEPPVQRLAGRFMLYTSGTTGRPKGVDRSFPGGTPEQAALSLRTGVTTFAVPADGVTIVTGPLYHAAPLIQALNALNLGHTLVVMERFDAERCLALIAGHGVTCGHFVPTMFHRLLRLPDHVRSGFDVSGLEHVLHGAAPCPVHVKRRMIDWWGPIVNEYYAATEGGGTYATSADWLARPGTVGRAVRGAEIAIVDETSGDVLPPGHDGLVYILPAVGGFSYHDDPARTTAVHRADGSFTLGDIGHLDEDGYLFLTDRSADVIITGGMNVYPAEVEAVLLEHPDVSDAVVVGVPDEEWGERVIAVVQASATSGLAEWCRERLAPHKCPREFVTRDELPREPTGKLARRLVRDELRLTAR